MKRSDFSYELPDALIAQEPRERGRSRMMVVSPNAIEHRSFAELPDLLDPSDVLVINDTRVIPARLFAQPKGEMTRPIELLKSRIDPARTVVLTCGNPDAMADIAWIAGQTGMRFEKEDW